MKSYIFWNNKGGTGKTSLAFQTICRFAKDHPQQRILAIDVCPQANLSELMLGGLTNRGSENLLKRQSELQRATIGGYFQLRLPSPYTPPAFAPEDFITQPIEFNRNIAGNIDLLCGDPLLELQSNAISTLANTQIPGTDTWIKIIDWLRDFLAPIKQPYDVIFFDTNPSFSIYTQIALSTAERLLIPVMADDSSRRGVRNAFSLIYGLKLPSEIYSKYAFATKLENSGRELPLVHLIIKNRLTQYMGPASAYGAVLKAIERDVKSLLNSNPDIFSFTDAATGFVNIRDFQTTGVVAFARGCPFYKLSSGRLDLMGKRIQVQDDYQLDCVLAVNEIVKRL